LEKYKTREKQSRDSFSLGDTFSERSFTTIKLSGAFIGVCVNVK
jgi:hypothetical protein